MPRWVFESACVRVLAGSGLLGPRQPSHEVTMRRIGLAVVLAISLLAPLALEAQQAGKVYRIGFLGLSSAEDYAPNIQAFRQGLRDLGYEEGKTISIEYRWAQGREERLPALAAELVRLNPAVLVTQATPAIRAPHHPTTTIPTLMPLTHAPV